ALNTPADLDVWLNANGLEEHGITPAATDLERFRDLRAALHRLFAARNDGCQPSADDINLVNTVTAAAPTVEQLDWDADGPRKVIDELAAKPEVVVEAIARSAVELLTQATVGQCQAPGCVLFFTKDARRRNWCSAACGNRARVARHYVRHRQMRDEE